MLLILKLSYIFWKLEFNHEEHEGHEEETKTFEDGPKTRILLVMKSLFQILSSTSLRALRFVTNIKFVSKYD